MGISLGIKNTRPKTARHNPILEKAYQHCKKFTHKQVRLGFEKVCSVFANFAVVTDSGACKAIGDIGTTSRTMVEIEEGAG